MPREHHLAFTIAEWAPLNEAFARVKAGLDSHRLAERDVLGHLRSGRLASAMRIVERNGDADGFERLKPSFWKGLTLLAPHDVRPDGLPASVQVRGLARLTAITRSTLWFFVARRDLDMLYPIAAAAEPETEMSPPRRKPGRKVRKNWKLFVAAELHRIVEVEGKPPPAAAHFAQLCVNKLDHHPDIREVQKLLRQLL